MFSRWGGPPPLPCPACGLGKLPTPPGRVTEPPLVKLYLVFLFHPPIETLSVNDPPDVLDRQKCLTALASLRHAKWFQVCILSLFVLKQLSFFLHLTQFLSLVVFFPLFLFLNVLSKCIYHLQQTSYCGFYSVSKETFVITLQRCSADLTGLIAVSLKMFNSAFRKDVQQSPQSNCCLKPLLNFDQRCGTNLLHSGAIFLKYYQSINRQPFSVPSLC